MDTTKDRGRSPDAQPLATRLRLPHAADEAEARYE
jgi:hypothetical protein